MKTKTDLLELFAEYLMKKYNTWYATRYFEKHIDLILRQEEEALKRFKEKGINPQQYRDYFAYQLYRFTLSKYFKNLTVLTNYESIEKFQNVKEYIGKILYKNELKKVFKAQEKNSKKNLFNEKTLTIEKNVAEDMKLRFIKTNDKNEILSFCILSEINFNKGSKICLKCKQKRQCLKRKKTLI